MMRDVSRRTVLAALATTSIAPTVRAIGVRFEPKPIKTQGQDINGNNSAHWPLFQANPANTGHDPSATGPKEAVTPR